MASSDSRVSSEHEEDQTPTRLSALYQYHNAPEVAPAHGLEYDDTVYPVSDKFPVIKETKFSHGHGHYTGKHAYVNDNKPPRIIFGMKVKTFLVVATVMVLVIVGAAVGGAVGGKNLYQGQPSPAGTYNDMSGTSSSAAASPTATTTTATTYAAATPTYTPLQGCLPSADNTTYTSQYSSSLAFSMHCDVASPLNAQASSSTAQLLAASYVYSFADCTELCAGLIANANVSCTFAVYKPTAPRPANCWTGKDTALNVGSLATETGTEVAVLLSS